jgi:peptidyl-prolyl cis-trans isomerase B (cyclophilin B)
VKRLWILLLALVVPAMSLCAAEASSPDQKEAPAAQVKKKAPSKKAGKTVVITMANGGVIKFKLYSKEAPITTANFTKLIKKGFYNGLNFHRVEPGFVVQGGDPNGNGSGGPGWTIKGEFSKSLKHVEGTVSMARTNDPDSAGSQFYICLAPAPFLDNNYAIFGQVTEGMDVVHKIAIGDKMTKVELQ